jgi:hypothetical protein
VSGHVSGAAARPLAACWLLRLAAPPPGRHRPQPAPGAEGARRQEAGRRQVVRPRMNALAAARRTVPGGARHRWCLRSSAAIGGAGCTAALTGRPILLLSTTAAPPDGDEERWSDFGKRFTADSGINRLMDDLADATRPGAPPILMMGGGNPAQIPEVKEALRETMLQLLHDDEPRGQTAPLLHAISNYDGPPGGKGLVEAVAEHFTEKYGWGITAEHVALTNGSQSSFFYLFNALAGEVQGKAGKKVLFPLCPEYLGYEEVGLSDNMFTSVLPRIDIDEEAKEYKYSIDFERLEAEVDWSAIGVVCVSRPTNPTGNVLTDAEVERLDACVRTSLLV